jgi:uncharacterized alkaline shock family protein YloU
VVQAGSSSIEDTAIAEAVAAAARRVPGVADVASDLSTPVVTYGIGKVIWGVAVQHDADRVVLDIRITALYERRLSLPDLAGRVRMAAREAVGALRAGPVKYLNITVGDLITEEV